MVSKKKVAGIVLSGGMSSRMGQEKGLVKFREKALIEYAIQCISPLVDEVLISTNSDEYAYLELPMVQDLIPNCGPMGGIYSCMKAYDADHYLVISCDVPCVSSDLYRDLLNEINDANAIVAFEKEKRHPLLAVYRASVFSFVESQMKEENYRMMNLLERVNAVNFSVHEGLSYYHEHLLANTNSLKDLEGLD